MSNKQGKAVYSVKPIYCSVLCVAVAAAAVASKLHKPPRPTHACTVQSMLVVIVVVVVVLNWWKRSE